MHQIRLAKPWTHCWRVESQSRQAVYQRRFHRPTGLATEQQVLLVVALQMPTFADSVRAFLNEEPLSWQAKRSESDAVELETSIGHLLQPFNQLALQFEWTPPLEAAFATGQKSTPDTAEASAPPPLDQLLSARIIIVDAEQ